MVDAKQLDLKKNLFYTKMVAMNFSYRVQNVLIKLMFRTKFLELINFVQ